MVVVARVGGAALASSSLTAALFTASAIVVAIGVTSALSAGSARGSCSLRPSQLKAGQYQLTAAYGGSDVYDRSTSAAHSLTVAK